MSAPKIHSYRLPDLIALCPWKTSFNAHYDTMAPAASQWVLRYASAAPELEKRLPFFASMRGSELLAAWVYPYADAAQLRVCCDYLNLLYVVDELSDCQDGRDAHAMARTVMRALTDDAFADGTPLCAMTQDFKARLFPHAGPRARARFLKEMEDYVAAVTTEVRLREGATILDLAAYERLRRLNSGMPGCFEMFACLFGVELPDAVYRHPAFQAMYYAAVDMTSWANDVYSYRLEVLRGLEGNNVMSVLQQEERIGVQEAADRIGVHFKELVDRYESGKALLPSFGEDVDQDVRKFCRMMECWSIGNIEWSFATGRYFADGAKVKESLVVDLSA